MINNHLHIWDSVWSDEYKKMKDDEQKSSNETNVSTTDIMVGKTNKRGKK